MNYRADIDEVSVSPSMHGDFDDIFDLVAAQDRQLSPTGGLDQQGEEDELAKNDNGFVTFNSIVDQESSSDSEEENIAAIALIEKEQEDARLQGKQSSDDVLQYATARVDSISKHLDSLHDEVKTTIRRSLLQASESAFSSEPLPPNVNFSKEDYDAMVRFTSALKEHYHSSEVELPLQTEEALREAQIRCGGEDNEGIEENLQESESRCDNENNETKTTMTTTTPSTTERRSSLSDFVNARVSTFVGNVSFAKAQTEEWSRSDSTFSRNINFLQSSAEAMTRAVSGKM